MRSPTRRRTPKSSTCSSTTPRPPSSRGSGRWTSSPSSSNNFVLSTKLLLRDLCALDDRGPALGLGGVELAELFGRAGAAFDAELGEALLHVGICERLHQR